MDAREKLNEFAELRGWDKSKLIGWSEAADFGEWLVKNLNIPAACDSCGRYANLIYTTSQGRFCERCKPAS